MTIGNDILPGIITDVKSLTAVSTSGLSDANVALVGKGDVSEGEADANTPYTITRPTNVANMFGDGSELTKGVLDALAEGAMPVYAVMAAGDTAEDYENALDALESEEADSIDVLGVISTDEDVAQKLETTVNSMESYHQFALAVTGADVVDGDTSLYKNPFNNSRVQLIYPAENNSGDSVVGSFVGLHGRLGINGSVMNKRLKRHSRLSHRLDKGEQMELLGENVVPIASETRGALVIDDPTSIDSNDPDEGEMSLGFTRMVVDRVTEIVKETEEPFIGRLNNPAARGSLQAMISSQLRFLKEQDAILDYDVSVQRRDADSAFVEVQIETVKPLRNIYNTVAAGRME